MYDYILLVHYIVFTNNVILDYIKITGKGVIKEDTQIKLCNPLPCPFLPPSDHFLSLTINEPS